MKYFYSLTKDGYLFIWKWVDDFLTEEYKKVKNFQNFKKGIFLNKGRKIKLEDSEKNIFDEEE